MTKDQFQILMKKIKQDKTIVASISTNPAWEVQHVAVSGAAENPKTKKIVAPFITCINKDQFDRGYFYYMHKKQDKWNFINGFLPADKVIEIYKKELDYYKTLQSSEDEGILK